jgi:hypothetical protein
VPSKAWVGGDITKLQNKGSVTDCIWKHTHTPTHTKTQKSDLVGSSNPSLKVEL